MQICDRQSTSADRESRVEGEVAVLTIDISFFVTRMSLFASHSRDFDAYSASDTPRNANWRRMHRRDGVPNIIVSHVSCAASSPSLPHMTIDSVVRLHSKSMADPQ